MAVRSRDTWAPRRTWTRTRSDSGSLSRVAAGLCYSITSKLAVWRSRRRLCTHTLLARSLMIMPRLGKGIIRKGFGTPGYLDICLSQRGRVVTAAAGRLSLPLAGMCHLRYPLGYYTLRRPDRSLRYIPPSRTIDQGFASVWVLLDVGNHHVRRTATRRV